MVIKLKSRLIDNKAVKNVEQRKITYLDDFLLI